MKKLFLSAAAMLFALTAGAQNKSIDALAEKYAGRDGVTVVNMEGEALKGLSSMVANSDGTIELGDGKKYPVSDLFDDIVAVTAIVLGQADDAFALEAQAAIGSAGYSPVVSHNDAGQSVRILSADIRRGKFRGNREIVIMVSGNDNTTVLVRLIGQIDTALLSKMATDMKK